MTKCIDCKKLTLFLIYEPKFCSNCRSEKLGHFPVDWLVLILVATVVLWIVSSR